MECGAGSEVDTARGACTLCGYGQFSSDGSVCGVCAAGSQPHDPAGGTAPPTDGGADGCADADKMAQFMAAVHSLPMELPSLSENQLRAILALSAQATSSSGSPRWTSSRAKSRRPCSNSNVR